MRHCFLMVINAHLPLVIETPWKKTVKETYINDHNELVTREFRRPIFRIVLY